MSINKNIFFELLVDEVFDMSKEELALLEEDYVRETQKLLLSNVSRVKRRVLDDSKIKYQKNKEDRNNIIFKYPEEIFSMSLEQKHAFIETHAESASFREKKHLSEKDLDEIIKNILELQADALKR